MNVLRELRRIENRSKINKTRAILLLCTLLITSTFAWFTTQKSVDISEIKGTVDSWDVIYKYDDQILDEEIIFNISDFYPGKTYSKVIDIYNMGKNPSEIKIELLDAIYMNESKMIYLNANDGIKTYADGRIVKVFDTDDYPFEIIYTLNRKYMYTQYCEDFDKDSEENKDAVATLTITLNWDYEQANSDSDSNTTVRDNSDTIIGNTVYNYYNSIKNETNYDELCAKVLELKLKITSETTGIDEVNKNENIINGIGNEYINNDVGL